MRSIALLAVTLGLLAGCVSTPGGNGLFVHPATVTTNAAGLLATNVSPNFVVNPGVANTLGATQEVISCLPIPWAPLISGALVVLSGVLGIIAKVKGDKAKILPAIIAGVEAAANNADVKKAIQAEATAQGVQTALHKEVRRITG